MKIVYDEETDILTIIFNDSEVAESDEIREGVIIDYSKNGLACAVEILDASEIQKNPLSILYEINRVATA